MLSPNALLQIQRKVAAACFTHNASDSPPSNCRMHHARSTQQRSLISQYPSRHTSDLSQWLSQLAPLASPAASAKIPAWSSRVCRLLCASPKRYRGTLPWNGIRAWNNAEWCHMCGNVALVYSKETLKTVIAYASRVVCLGAISGRQPSVKYRMKVEITLGNRLWSSFVAAS